MKKTLIFSLLLIVLSFSACSMREIGRFTGVVERSGCHTFGCQ